MSDDIVCAQRESSDETMYHALLSEAQVQDLAAGFVPKAAKAQMLDFLDWLDADRRKADRPVETPKKRTSA